MGVAVMAGTTKLASWPRGKAVIIDRTKQQPLSVPADGKYHDLGRITIPKGGRFDLSAAIRLPEGCWARWRFVRIGWGADPDGRDETGCQPLLDAPDGKATSHTPKSHPMAGGGPVAYEIKVYGSSVVALPVVKLMASRQT